MMNSNSQKAAQDILVETFYITLLWPVSIITNNPKKQNEETNEEFLINIQKKLQDSSWEPWKDPFPADESIQHYAEWLYHHKFVRDALYVSRSDRNAYLKNNKNLASEKPAPNRNLKRYRRQDLKTMEVSIDKNSASIQLKVDDNTAILHVFDCKVAILSISLECNNITLKQSLNLRDKLRRCYAPYFSSDNKKFQPGHFPEEIILQFENTNNNVSFEASADKLFDDHLRYIQKHSEPYTISIWQKLIEPILPVSASGEIDSTKIYFEHINDDRIPLMTYLAVENPRLITDPDWCRLAFIDEPGDSFRYPYSSTFLTEEYRKYYFYDRFWPPDSSTNDLDYYNTRWLCSQNSFTGVGSRKDMDPHFFNNEKTGARAHFDHHYYTLFLLVQLQRTGLLLFKAELSQAVEELNMDKNEYRAKKNFEKRLIRIEKDLLNFRSLYWSSEISNQDQGRELFDMLTHHARTKELFEHVNQQTREANKIVGNWNQKTQQETILKLTWMQAAFLIFPLVVACIESCNKEAQRFKLVFLIVGIVIAAIILFGQKISRIVN